jgi:hypothetical protein
MTRIEEVTDKIYYFMRKPRIQWGWLIRIQSEVYMTRLMLEHDITETELKYCFEQARERYKSELSERP